MSFDHSFFSKLRQGDQEAFREFMEAHKDSVYKVAINLLRDSGAAADVTQETFLKAYQVCNTIDPEKNVEGWLKRIAARFALNLMQKTSFKYETTHDFSEDLPESNTGVPDENILTREIYEQLEEAIEELPPKQKAAIVLHYMHEMSISDVAETTDSSPESVKVNLSHARKKLAESIQTRQKDQ